MKKYLLAGILAAASTTAIAEITGDVSLVSDYRFRGISQSNEDPAIQGSFKYQNEGLYVGIWGSSIDFQDTDAGTLELDYFAGFEGKFNETFGYDVGAIYYDYPNSDTSNDLEYYEFYGAVNGNFDKLQAEAKVSYSPDYFGETGDTIYAEVEGSLALGHGFSAVGHVGYLDFSKDGAFTSDEDNYMDYKVGLEKNFQGVDFGAYYVATNLDDSDDCGGTNFCDNSYVLQISKSF